MRTFLIPLLLGLVPAAALGRTPSYQCVDGHVLVDGKPHDAASTAARLGKQCAALNKQIATLKKKRGSARTIASKTKSYKSLKKALKVAANCQAAPAPIPPLAPTQPASVPQTLADFVGVYPNGALTSDAPTFNGPFSAVFGSSGAEFSGAFSFGGALSLLLPAPVSFSFDAGGATLPLTKTVTGTSLGDLSVTFGADHTFSIVASNVPPNAFVPLGTVTLTGALSSGAINGTIVFASPTGETVATTAFTLSR